MKLLIGKTILYIGLILICLEIITRVFHLYQQYPPYILNDLNIEVNAPNQKGHYVTGNRRMNYAEFNINKTGFNSYREFIPTKDDIEVALIGDSFIEGFHQDYYNSTGKKIENLLDNKVKVFEYGYSGYDLADQLELIKVFEEDFKKIDYVFVYMKFYTDLERDKYEPNTFRVNLQNSLSFKLKDKIKLLAYAEGIGIVESIKKLKDNVLGKENIEREYIDDHASEEDTAKYLKHFKTLANTYNIDKTKTVFLLDKKKTSPLFLDYCNTTGLKYLDFGAALDASKTPTTLIYDQHWNDHGRHIIASVISNYVQEQIKKSNQ